MPWVAISAKKSLDDFCTFSVDLSRNPDFQNRKWRNFLNGPCTFLSQKVVKSCHNRQKTIFLKNLNNFYFFLYGPVSGSKKPKSWVRSQKRNF